MDRMMRSFSPRALRRMLTSTFGRSRRVFWGFGLALLIQASVPMRATTQAIPKPDYVTYLPRDAALPVQATVGNRQFHLFGDAAGAGYRDEAPRDGIDDAREQWLHSLAVRFAPWMVRNSVDFPMDFRRFVETGEWSTLFIDAMDLSQARPRLVGTETIEFGRLADRVCSGLTTNASETVDTTTDCGWPAAIHQSR